MFDVYPRVRLIINISKIDFITHTFPKWSWQQCNCNIMSSDIKCVFIEFECHLGYCDCYRCYTEIQTLWSKCTERLSQTSLHKRVWIFFLHNYKNCYLFGWVSQDRDSPITSTTSCFPSVNHLSDTLHKILLARQW